MRLALLIKPFGFQADKVIGHTFNHLNKCFFWSYKRVIVHALLKSTLGSFTCLFACLLFTLANFTVLAQQNEQSNAEKVVQPTTSATENTPDKKNVDKEKDNRMAVPAPISLTLQQKDDLKHFLPTKHVQSLLAGPEEYITLITENSSINSKGVAILLPDWQQGATNPKAINFLRKQLPLHGWTTISIQPTSKPDNYPSHALKITEQQEENKTTLADYQANLGTMMNAVIEKANEYPGIIMIIAQGNHGAMLVDLLNQDIEPSKITQAPNALILLSSYVLTTNNLLDETNTLFAKQVSNSEYPVLDLTLKHDNPIVLAKAKQRLALSKQEMKVYYRQRQLNNVAMGYYPEQELLTQVNSWLKAIGW